MTGLEIITDGARIPLGACQQPLHPMRACLARLFSQLPPVLALNRTEQLFQIPALFGMCEACPNPLLNLVHSCGPCDHLNSRRPHRKKRAARVWAQA